MEGLTGIEPASPAWEAGALPLSYSPVMHPESMTGPNKTLDALTSSATGLMAEKSLKTSWHSPIESAKRAEKNKHNPQVEVP